MNYWQHHDEQMIKLKRLYDKQSVQTQQRLQDIFNRLELTPENLYNIASNKTKKMIDNEITKWKDKKLLNGYFGSLANNIYNRRTVKNNEILELLIYGAYIEEQEEIKEQEQQIMYEDVNYYYKQGQQEVLESQHKTKPLPIIDMALFLYLLEQPSYNGYNFKQYIDATIQYNAQQLYKQAIINIAQQKELEIDSNEFQRVINLKNNQRLNFNNGKISGTTDLNLIGLNNLAKVEGIKEVAGDNSQVRFIAVEDNRTTKMCNHMDGKLFYINKENRFDRYWGETANELTLMPVSVKGLVPGVNLPPIIHHFHWCRSSITYYIPVEKEKESKYNMEYIRKNSYTNHKNLDSNIKGAINKLPDKIKKLLCDTKLKTTNINSYYDRKNDTIYLLRDSNKYEILHEIGHMIETKLDILHDKKYIDIQNKGLRNINPITDINKIKGYGENDFIIDTGKFISEYQRRAYDNDIDNNPLINYSDFSFNPRTLGEYFSEGFRCYYQENKLLKRKDIDLYNYIKEVLK